MRRQLSGRRHGRSARASCAWSQIVVCAVLFSASQQCIAYSGAQHQQFMFVAARQYNDCVRDTPEQQLTALQVRYAARAAVGQADASFLRRMFRWGFYERESQAPKSTLWVVETRMHEHFNELLRAVDRARKPADQFAVAGRIAAYVQDVTSPARTVPVYTSRWWRLNTSDRFDNYRVAPEALEAATRNRCDALFADDADYQQILRDTANATLAAVQGEIPGLPTSWQAFWRLSDNPANFGEYGVAGNRFGLRTTFRCGNDRCVMLSDDPLYQDFALKQHVLAVLGTMRVLHRLQQTRERRPLTQPAAVPPIPAEGDAPTPENAARVASGG